MRGENHNISFDPIDAILEPDPAELLNVITCNYNLKTKVPCGANNYYCRKNSLLCVISCGNCHKTNCTNVSKFKIIGDSEDEGFDRNAFKVFDI